MRGSARTFFIAALGLILLISLAWPQQFSANQSAVEQDAASYLASVRHDPQALRAFMARLPKGGELHNHLSGAPLPDRLLELAASSKQFHYYVRVPLKPAAADDPAAYALFAVSASSVPAEEKGAKYVSVSALIHPQSDEARAQQQSFRQAQTIREGEPDPLGVFYGAIFQRRGFVVGSAEFIPQMVIDAVAQAHQDHLNYLELQINPFPSLPETNTAEISRAVNVTTAREFIAQLIAAVEQANKTWPADQRVEVRFILAFSRTNTKIFGYLPIAFEIAATNDAVGTQIAGINLVGNEYSQDSRIGQQIAGPENLRDYLLTLHRIYPKVRLSIHAGEGTRWDWHIRDSILMGAERIGHATNLQLSPDASEPELMRRNQILVEACLTSNHLLLGVPLDHHPFLNYLRAGIPVSLNSDDPGVFTTNMTEEFARAVEYYPELGWPELTELSRNSLSHAFVPEATKRELLARWQKDLQTFEAPKNWPKWLAQPAR